jgi:hypothetical protein
MFEASAEFLNFPQKRALDMLPAKRAGARVARALRRSSVRCTAAACVASTTKNRQKISKLTHKTAARIISTNRKKSEFVLT